MEKLTNLLKLTEQDLKHIVFDYLVAKKMSPISDDGYVYAKGKIPVLLVAHLDTVFDTPPNRLIYDKNKDLLFSPTGGLGGDDRCGVYAIMKILEELKPHVLFTEDEEIGGLGAIKATKKLDKPNVKYIIEFDRHGNNDCVFYDCHNQDFINYIESFNFKTALGTFSDIVILSSVWDIASVNISSGYYNEHTPHEYIKFQELLVNIERVKNILKKTRQANYFNLQKYPQQTTTHNLILENMFLDDYFLTDEYLKHQLRTKSDCKQRILKK